MLKATHPAWQIDDRAIEGLSLHSLMAGYTTGYSGGPVPLNGPQPPFAQAPHPSRYVVLELGGNDAYDGYAPAQFEVELTQAVTDLQTLGKVPILTGIVRVDTWGVFDADAIARSQEMDAITRQVAARLGVAHAGWSDLPARTTDGIHPTDEQLAVLVERLAATLDVAAQGQCR